MLARKGYCPILLERGEDVDARTRRVEAFWKNGVLNPASNVQFGEGGAGTFFRWKAEYAGKGYLWTKQRGS